MKELKTIIHQWVDPCYENEIDETSFTIHGDGEVRISSKHSNEDLFIHIDELADIASKLRKHFAEWRRKQ